ncbi:MAG: ATP-binding protein [bacterium]
MPRKQKKYRLKFPSQSDNLEIIRDAVSRIAEKAGFDENNINMIELAVDEACANVVNHAFQESGSQPINIEITVGAKKFIIVVSDRGKGFDLQKLRKPDMKEYISSKRVGGLGIHIIQTLMDEVQFHSESGKGTHVRMVKLIKNERIASKASKVKSKTAQNE